MPHEDDVRSNAARGDGALPEVALAGSSSRA